jgi:transcriptional adapter 2-alpha
VRARFVQTLALNAHCSEFENEAETLIKDMEFDLVLRYGGIDQPKAPKPDPSVPITEDLSRSAEEDAKLTGEEPPLAIEDDEDLELKMTILDIYNERYDRRVETKALIFDRALTEYKKVGRHHLCRLG